ncbi:MAG: VRR-NUC domain-containing protein [Butyrivibrio sp.]|nr:VRR-NUC domain-containing protein [Butyrivibrio sp.]
MTEKYIEQKLRALTKERGGLALKFVSPGTDGVPDRLVLMPMGKMAFVETKALGKKMRALQQRRAEQLKRLGFKVYLVDDTKMIGGILDEIQSS